MVSDSLMELNKPFSYNATFGQKTKATSGPVSAKVSPKQVEGSEKGVDVATAAPVVDFLLAEILERANLKASS